MARIDLRENEFMEQFVSQNHVDSNDVQFWHQLLSCSFNFMRVQDPKLVEKTLDPYLVRLSLNNSESLNIGSLVRVFLDRVSRIKSPNGHSINPNYVFQSFNALYLLRSICKSYIESLSEEQLIKAFRARIDPPHEIQPQGAPQQLPPQPPAQMNPNPSMPVAHTVQIDVPPPPPPANAYNVTSPLSPPPQPPPPYQLHPTENVSTTNHHHEVQADNLGQTEISYQAIPNEHPIPNITKDALIEQPNSTPDIKLESAADANVQEIKKKADVTSGANMLDQFIATLIAILVDIPQSDSTYLLQVESINSLLVLLSVQMYSVAPTNQSLIYKCLMHKKCSIHALILTKTLLNNFVKQQQVPQEAGSIIIGLASGLWKVLTLGYGSQEDEEQGEEMPLLAKQSLLLLNVLTNHYMSEKNPYREAMISCQDSSFSLSDPRMAFENANNDAMATATTSKSVMMSNSIKIDFKQLYQTICRYLHNDQVALLLYLLLHSNKIFRPFILTSVSSDLDKLLLPLLKILYASIERGSHHVYMVLILFIILSEEETFNIAIHKITLRGVPWYKDRIFSELSLGSLTVLIIVRSFQYNTFRIRDKFLHTNLFATLANLSNHFDQLHPYVCQRITDLLERLTKRYLMATKQQQQQHTDKPRTLDILNINNPLAKALATDTQKQDLQDASSIELDSTSNAPVMTNSSQQPSRDGPGINISVPSDQQQQQQVADTANNPIHERIQDHHSAAIGSSVATEDEKSGQQSPRSESINISMDESKQDISLIEEVIRMLLEVINNSLATRLRNNPDLIYTLLYKRGIFNSLLSSHQSFYNMVINIERILTFFYSKIENFERQLNVEEIKETIESNSKDWNFDATGDTNNRLLFHYVEDEQPGEFFIPYIWTRIYYSSGIVWNSKRIVLFNPDDI